MGPFCSYFFHTKYTSFARKRWLLVLLLQRTKIWTERLLSNLQNSWYFIRLWIFCVQHRFDILALRKYYFRLKNELIKCFYHSPRSTQTFLGENTTSVVETGTQVNTGEFLFQKTYDIQTQFFSQKIRDKKRTEKCGPFWWPYTKGEVFLNLR